MDAFLLIKLFFSGSRRPDGVVDCNIVINELKFESCFYVHFQTNTLGKGMISFITPSTMGLNYTTTVLLQRRI